MCPGPTGMPESDNPVLGYCALGPWPMSAVNNGANMATSTRNTMKPNETMATRSWRSRVHASCHGVRPTMSVLVWRALFADDFVVVGLLDLLDPCVCSEQAHGPAASAGVAAGPTSAGVSLDAMASISPASTGKWQAVR